MRYWLPPRTSRSSSDWSRSTDCRYRFTSLALPAPHQMPPEPPISKRLAVSPAIFDASSTRAATSGTYTLRVSTMGASAGAPVALFHPDSIRTQVGTAPRPRTAIVATPTGVAEGGVPPVAGIAIVPVAPGEATSASETERWLLTVKPAKLPTKSTRSTYPEGASKRLDVPAICPEARVTTRSCATDVVTDGAFMLAAAATVLVALASTPPPPE